MLLLQGRARNTRI